MLRMCINPRAVRQPWRWEGKRLECGPSWVEPVLHPALECLTATDAVSGAFFATVRERCPGSGDLEPQPVGDVPVTPSDEYGRLLSVARTWPMDSLTVEVIPSTGAVAVHAGRYGIAPLYVTANNGDLHGSWDMADLVPHLPGSLDLVESTRLLALWFRYTHRTCFTGLYRVTERATALFENGRLNVRLPEPAEHSAARTLKPDADVLGAYGELLDGVLDRHVFDPETTSAHLSGGMDSGVTATHAAYRYPGRILASAMLVPGPGGAQQRRRRADMVRLSDFRADITTVAAKLPPLHPAGDRAQGRFVSPYEEPYYEATNALLVDLAGLGVRTVITGVGGDEMMALTSDESPHLPIGPGHQQPAWLGTAAREALHHADDDIAPPSVVNEMTLLAFAASTPLMLRSGIWPIHPFADPSLIRFGEWLPRAWRSDKTLHRERLAHLNMPPEVVRPVLAENFTPVMNLALLNHIPPMAARILRYGSPLIDTKLIDPDALTTAVDRLHDGHIQDSDSLLYDVIALDLAARTALT